MDKVFGYVARCVNAKQPMYPFMTLMAIWGNPKHREPAMCHKWGYFKTTLRELLERVGMREIQFTIARYHFPFRDMRVECLK